MSQSRTIKICNERGLHARAAAKFAKLAENYQAQIIVQKNDDSAPGDSIMELLMLGAAKGTTITISATGPDAAQALDELSQLVLDKFGEDR